MKNLILILASLFILATGCQKDALQDVTTPEDSQQLINTGDPGDLVTSRSAFPDWIPLPFGFNAEGIEVGNGTDFYVSSLNSGSIFKGNLSTGEGAVFNDPPGTPAVGLSFDARSNLLFVAGAGEVLVYHGTSGALVATYLLPVPACGANPLGLGSLPNDLIVTKKAVYVTDSFTSYFYEIPLGPAGQLPNAAAVKAICMDGFVYSPDPNFLFINANGIVATPNGKKLIINNMATGLFYLVDPKTGDATEISISGKTPAELVWGDGLLLDGHHLYITQNFPNNIAVIKMSPDFTSGAWVKDIQDPANFNEPATIAKFGSHLYAVNAHFFEIYQQGIDPANLPYEVVRVPK